MDAEQQACRGLHAIHTWEPYPHTEPGEPRRGAFRRSDGAGYVIEQEDGRWWTTWAHPMLCGRPGWHHHAFGTYTTATTGAMAFDQVYELERLQGNKDRMTREDWDAFNEAKPEPAPPA
jgi:hypothetical protein